MTRGEFIPLSVDNARDETVALLALLRLVPTDHIWADVASTVRFAGSAIAVLNEREVALVPDPGVAEAVQRADADLAAWEQEGLDLVTILSPDYPTQLAGVFDCPPFLFVRGTLLPDDLGMSVVGSRRCSETGAAMARQAVDLLAERDLSVIAGLAEGIDAAAHREALRIGARTVAVIGTGIKVYYPASNRVLQDEIGAKGLVISQFYPDQPPTKQTFPMRNGTMSGYGLATIVVEAGENSGSRIQARKAADHGRPVILSAQVARSTSWGRVMADHPWVYVVGSHSELADAIDQIAADHGADTLSRLGLVPA